MLQLSANAVVTYQSITAGNYGSTNGLINAQGLLYSPLGGAAAAVAWCVKDPAASLGSGYCCAIQYHQRQPTRSVEHSHQHSHHTCSWHLLH
jgi:hypothetical protein